MTGPADLSKLRINRDAPSAPERKAFTRNLLLFLGAIGIVVVTVALMRARAVPTVQVVTVAASTSPGAGSSGSVTSVTANGYVAARTKASVSAKIAGRLAYLGVSEGSVVRRGERRVRGSDHH
jgi:multidrug efflux pump subunit AcrA (membrane-fusion protein)